MFQIDQYAYRNIYRTIHPIEKGVFTLSFLAINLVTKNIAVAIFTFIVMSLAILLGAKIPFYFYLKLLMLPFFFLFMSVLTILITITSSHTEIIGAIFQYELGMWQIYISQGQLKLVQQLVFTVIASVSCMYFLILTTPISEIVWLLQKLKTPSLLIELILLTYRFIFVLLGSVREIQLAQTSRLGYRTFRGAIYSVGILVGSLFLKTMKAAKDLQMAMDSRGNGQGVYEVEIFQTYKPRNWLVIVCLTIILSTLALFD